MLTGTTMFWDIGGLLVTVEGSSEVERLSIIVSWRGIGIRVCDGGTEVEGKLQGRAGAG